MAKLWISFITIASVHCFTVYCFTLFMKLIVGLGNPGPDYEYTKHNLGFLIVDQIAKQRNASTRTMDKKSNSLTSKTKIPLPGRTTEGGGGGTKGGDILFIKPQTYMNLSGQSVAFWMNFYKLNPATDLLVIHDDVDIPAGEVRYKKGGSSGGQNGIKDIIAKLGTDAFDRVKIGVGRPSHPAQSVADHVLDRLSQAQRDALPDYTDQALSKINHHFLQN